jgi:thiol-disulfide isomerase/thioredoxin
MLLRFPIIVVLVVSFSWAAEKPAQENEDDSLQQALGEAGASAVDLVQALEQHLAKFPKTEKRPEIERALLKASIGAGDQKRTIEYGERVLTRESLDLKTLDAVIGALLAAGDQDHAGRVVEYARRYEQAVREFEAEKPPSRAPLGEWRDQIDRAYGHAFLLEARGLSGLGRAPEALDLARKSYAAYPAAEAAREIGELLAKSGKDEEAVRFYAEAFAIPDEHNQEQDRAADRARMGELYRKLKGSESGLGDLVLQAYDRTARSLREREVQIAQLDPNAGLTNPLDFTLTDLDGGKLALASLKGKVLVLDFWATWCGPCRFQHGLYEHVKERFKDRPEVIFLSINTDEERDEVPNFIAENHWDKKVYFDDGMANALRISSLPTSILIDQHGKIASRLNGFLPDRFVDQLSERIRQALKE